MSRKSTNPVHALRAIDTKHTLLCIGLCLLSVVCIIFAGIALSLALSLFLPFSDNPELQPYLILSGLLAPLIFLLIKNMVIEIYERYQKSKIDDEQVGRFLSRFFYEHDIAYQPGKQNITFFCRSFHQSFRTRRLNQMMIEKGGCANQSSHMIKDLSQEDSSRIILAVFPKIGSLGLMNRMNLEITATLHALSAHEKMQLMAEMQK